MTPMVNLTEDTESVYHCPFCGFYSANIANVKKHVSKQHTESFCPICMKTYKNIRSHYLNRGADSPRHAMLYFLTTQEHIARRKGGTTWQTYNMGKEYYLKHYTSPANTPTTPKWDL